MPSLYDFIGMQDPLVDVLPVRRQRGPAYPPIPQEVEDSLLSQLAGGGLSMLGYVGSTFDKPGAAVRGLLAGQPDQLLNLIPFSDTLGITDEADRVSGRDLLEQYGMLGSNTPGLDFGDVAGFAAEVGLDPLTYLSFGASALTKAGRAADAAGTLAKASYGAGGELLQGARAAGIEAGQRGLVGLGLPFMDNVAIAGTGPWAKQIAGTLDTVGDYARFGNPVGLALGGVFDSTVKGATTRPGQIQARRITELEQAAEAAARSDVFDIMQPVREGGGLTTSPEEVAAFRMAETGTPLEGSYAQFQPQADALVNLGRKRYESEVAMGMDTPFMQDEFATEYLARQPAQFANEPVATARARAMDASHGFQQGRKDVYKNIPGATDTINKMSLDPFLSGPEAAAKTPALARAKYIRDNYLQFNDSELLQANDKLRELRGQLAKAKDEASTTALKKQIEQQAFETAKLAYTFKKSFNLADSLGSLDPQHLKESTPLFPNHPIYDALKREVTGRKAEARAQGLYEFVGKNARAAPQPGDVPLMDVVKQAGLGTQTVETLSKSGVEAARTRQLLQEVLGTDMEDDVLESLNDIESAADFVRVDEATKGVMTQLAKHLGGIDPLHAYVPAAIKDDALRMIQGFSSPEPASMIMGAVDKFTNLWKTSALARPSRIVRDTYSGQFMNWVAGLFSPRSLAGAHSIMTDGLQASIKGIENAPIFQGRGLTAEQATQEVIKLAFAHKIVQPFGGEFADLSTAAVSGSKLLGEVPGGMPMSFKSVLGEPWSKKNPGRFSPTMIRGVGAPGRVVNETQFAAAKMFENAAGYTDGLNRLSPFIEGIMQGMDPAVVARKVKSAQVDYSALTATERSVLKRVFPFYTFTKKMAPVVFKELIEKPGGKLAQTIRAENLSRDDQFLPPYLAPGLAIRLPESLGPGNGDTRFLTSIDLPHEAVFQLGRPSNTFLGTLEETGLGLMGQMHPFLKAPAEVFTGKQFYSGRDLADLDSRIGRVLYPDTPTNVPILLDQVLMNLPVTGPLMTTVGTVADPRKGWGAVGTNLLSGVKISDVDVERSRDRIARDAIEELMRSHPSLRSYTSFYVPQEAMGTLSPEEKLLMGEYSAIRNRARERAQQRNAGAGRL